MTRFSWKRTDKPKEIKFEIAKDLDFPFLTVRIARTTWNEKLQKCTYIGESFHAAIAEHTRRDNHREREWGIVKTEWLMSLERGIHFYSFSVWTQFRIISFLFQISLAAIEDWTIANAKTFFGKFQIRESWTEHCNIMQLFPIKSTDISNRGEIIPHSRFFLV